MKISRTGLLEAAERTLEQNKKDHEAAKAAYEQAFVDHEKQWIEEVLPLWGLAIDRLRAAFEAKQPITDAMLPRERGNLRTFSKLNTNRYAYDGPRDPGTYRPNKELVALIEVLKLVTDDEITPSGLQGLGITAKTLREAVLRLETGVN